jgi:hypothetical protein
MDELEDEAFIQELEDLAAEEAEIEEELKAWESEEDLWALSGEPDPVRLRRDVRADEGDEEELPHPLPHRHAVDEVRDAGVRRGVRGGECQPALEQEHPDEG